VNKEQDLRPPPPPGAPPPRRRRLPISVPYLSWRDLAFGIWPLVILTVIAFILAIRYVSPAPPHRLTMSTGPKDSTFEYVAQRYQRILARDGITLTLLPSEGSVENLNRLLDPKSKVDIALVQSGLPTPRGADTSDLVSLGSMFFEPVTLFYRGAADIQRISQLAGQRIAVGPEGSGVRLMALEMLKANGIDPADKSTPLLDLEGIPATKALLEHKVDAIFLTGDSASPDTLRDLLHSEGIRMFDFPRAEAYVRRFPYLNKVPIPAGAFDLGEGLPPTDINMLAPTVELLAHSKLHPALIDVLLAAAFKVHGRASLLQTAGQFPNPTAYTFPMSDEATRFYRTGNKSFVYRFLPFWLASLVNRLLVVVLPLVVVVVPGLRLLPQLYRWRINRRIHSRYGELMALEKETLGPDITPQRREQLLRRLEHIEKRTIGARTPGSHAEQLYQLRENIELVRENLRRGGGAASADAAK
jgi:TRAP transporter TAXI family solute receptor